MNAQDDIRENRREFLRRAGRVAAWTALAVTAALALWRRRPAMGQECIHRSLCRGCTAFDGCGLPAALSAKLAGEGKG